MGTRSGTPLSFLRLTSTIMSRGNSTKTMSSKNWQRGRSFSLETRPSRRVLTPNPSQEPTPQPSTCSPSMNAELTPELTETGKSCMKEVLRLSGQKCLNHAGRRSLVSGQRGQRPSFQNGLECAQAKSQETQRHQRARKMLQLKKRLKKTTKKKKRRRRRKKRRRRNKKFLSLCLTTSIQSM